MKLNALFSGLLRASFALGVVLFVHAVAAAQTPRLEGMWEMYNDANVKYDKLAKIAQSGGNLSINNGYGSNSTGVLDGNTLRTSDGLTGTVSADGSRIDWSNRYVWIKQGAAKVPAGLDLNGNWSMYEGSGKKYDKDAVITQNGASVTLDNGYGSRTTVNLNGFSLGATAWGLTGTIASDGSRIDWSNGFYWVKKYFANRPEVGNTTDTGPADNRTLTLKNGGAINVTVNLYKADRPRSDNTPVKTIKWIDAGQSPSVNFGAGLDPGTALEAEITMKVGGLGQTWDITIYRATVGANAGNLCFEVGGTAYKPTVQPCGGTKAVEADYVMLRNEAGFMANMQIDYTAETGTASTAQKTVRTDDTALGFERKLYLPRDAASYEMTLKINGVGLTGILLTQTLKTGKKTSDCYKVWGPVGLPSVGPCSLDGAARTIKFWNNSGVQATMEVTYNGNKVVSTNATTFGQTDTVAVPASKSPIQLRIWAEGTAKKDDAGYVTIPADFKGELCYKIEGSVGIAAVATCDDVVGDTFGETRRIRFQNDAGYDAQMVVTYMVDEVINGRTIMMPKILVTGMINGLGGKFRFVSIPKNTKPGMPVTISIQGYGTANNEIMSTTLPGDFTDGPIPCFKTWGTLFDPRAGNCGK